MGARITVRLPRSNWHGSTTTDSFILIPSEERRLTWPSTRLTTSKQLTLPRKICEPFAGPIWQRWHVGRLRAQGIVEQSGK